MNQREQLIAKSGEYLKGYKDGFDEGEDRGYFQGAADEMVKRTKIEWTILLFYIITGSFLAHLAWALIAILIGV